MTQKKNPLQMYWDALDLVNSRCSQTDNEEYPPQHTYITYIYLK